MVRSRRCRALDPAIHLQWRLYHRLVRIWWLLGRSLSARPRKKVKAKSVVCPLPDAVVAPVVVPKALAAPSSGGRPGSSGGDFVIVCPGSAAPPGEPVDVDPDLVVASVPADQEVDRERGARTKGEPLDKRPAVDSGGGEWVYKDYHGYKNFIFFALVLLRDVIKRGALFLKIQLAIAFWSHWQICMCGETHPSRIQTKP